MKKTPTLYLRDPQERRYVSDIVNPGCEWVFTDYCVPTRKVDGVCFMFDNGGTWWARREVKPGKQPPPGFWPVESDEVTGKTVGWERAEQSAFFRYLQEAIAYHLYPFHQGWTYELCGPKVNQNPEGFDTHVLIPHRVEYLGIMWDGTPDELVKLCRTRGWEGVVWHHEDGRRAKLKVRDVRE